MIKISSIAACLCMMLFGSGAYGQSPADGSTTQRPWIPFPGSDRSLIIVDALLNGKAVKALVDTGISGVIVNKSFAQREGMPLRDIGAAYSVGGMQQFYSTPHIVVGVDGIVGPDAAAQVADFSSFEKSAHVSFSLVIGASFIAAYGLSIDFDRRLLRFQAKRISSNSDVAIPMRFDGHRLIVDGSSAGYSISPLMIDIGSNGSLTLNSSAADHVERGDIASTDIEYIGASGSEVQQLIGHLNFKLGSLNFADVLSTVESKSTALDGQGIAGSLGLGLLSRYNVSLDASDSTMLLMPRIRTPSNDVRSTVGIQGDYREDRIAVTHVMKNSPAERAGIREGDAICSVDGKTIVDGWRQSPMLHWGSAAPGHRYVIGLCDTKVVQLTTASFY